MGRLGATKQALIVLLKVPVLGRLISELVATILPLLGMSDEDTLCRAERDFPVVVSWPLGGFCAAEPPVVG